MLLSGFCTLLTTRAYHNNDVATIRLKVFLSWNRLYKGCFVVGGEGREAPSSQSALNINAFHSHQIALFSSKKTRNRKHRRRRHLYYNTYLERSYNTWSFQIQIISWIERSGMINLSFICVFTKTVSLDKPITILK